MRALARAGFRMLEDDKATQRLILSDDSPRWMFFDNGNVNEFRKLHDLIVFLKTLPD